MLGMNTQQIEPKPSVAPIYYSLLMAQKIDPKGEMRQRPLISTVNVVENYYVIKRKHGEAAAHQLIDGLRAQTRSMNAEETVAVFAGKVKSENRMALGDAFAIATAS